MHSLAQRLTLRVATPQIQAGHTVLGLKADIDWVNITGSSGGTINFTGASIGAATLSPALSSLSTARAARVGSAPENWLFFATVGFDVTNEQSNLTE